MTVTINCDMGEGYGIYRLGDDAALMPQIDLANIACGFHAGDPTVMRETVALAKSHGVRIGAHPSLPDRQGFGRRRMELPVDALTDCLVYQIGALQGFLAHEAAAARAGVRLIAEFYADLDYDDAGVVIVPLHHDPVDIEASVARVLRACREGLVASASGRDVAVRADTVCVHSDTPGAAPLARALRQALAMRL